MPTALFTGFPGFIGSALLNRYLAASEENSAVCLVQQKFASLADRRIDELEREQDGVSQRIEMVLGDITRSGLGVATLRELSQRVTEVFHLAAVYDLSVTREFAMQVNVEGTRNLLAFAGACSQLRRLQYVSTCYVSGRHDGTFRESDLEKGQAFNNYYEETKYLAEVDVQAAMRDGLPVTIYRPAIVVGDSRTGATQKYDGPYFAIRWLLRQPRLAVMPIVGNPDATVVNLVPRDFIVEAISFLATQDHSAGKVYQLADPNPLTVRELIDCVANATGRSVVRLPLGPKVAKFAIDRIPGVFPLMQIPSSTIDYFVLPTRYDCTNVTRDLAGSGIVVPDFRTYVGRLVEFARQNPGIGSEAMV